MDYLLTPQEMTLVDKWAVDHGTPVAVLMERAGRAVADQAATMVAAGARILVLCGPGHNGGDGFVAARILSGRGFDVCVGQENRNPLTGLCGRVAACFVGPALLFSELDFRQFDLCIDAIFGAGLSRDVTGDAASCLRSLGQSGIKVLAVDVPSGLDGESGQVRGQAVKADSCVTFFRKKPGHLLQPGRDLCGHLIVADIGINPDCLTVISPTIIENTPLIWTDLGSEPSLTMHKYQRGSVLVLSSRLEFSGAARLAAKAALRAGAGLVTVATPPDAMSALAASSDAIMMRLCETPHDLEELLKDPRRNAVVVGPGLEVDGAKAEEARDFVKVAVAAGRGLVLDAGALTAYASLAPTLASLINQAGFTAGLEPVLTPHEGEFKHLFNGLINIVKPISKVERAREAARRMQAVIIYKGADSVIASPDGRVAINANGTPWLATAGSGDVLSGIIAALIAQGLPSFEAACKAVWLHAEAGHFMGAYLTADELPWAVQAVLRRDTT